MDEKCGKLSKQDMPDVQKLHTLVQDEIARYDSIQAMFYNWLIGEDTNVLALFACVFIFVILC